MTAADDQPAQPLTGAQILDLLREVADRLTVKGRRPVLILAGGSLLAAAGLRSTTDDDDSVRRLTEQVRSAATDVARAHDLKPTWLNDAAAPYAPVSLREDDCSVLLHHPNLLVLGAPLQQVFLMKMFASRPIDLADLAAMWPTVGFSTVDEAVEAFYAGYPHEEPDPHLASWLTGVIGQQPSTPA